MIIKKFIGKTEEEAVQAARKELGDGIVIMNVKNVKKKGLFSIFRKQQKEVTVALEEEELGKNRPAAEDEELKQALAQVSRIAREAEDKEKVASVAETTPTPAKAKNVAGLYEAGMQKTPEPAPAPVPVPAHTPEKEDLKADNFDKRLESLQELLEKQITSPIRRGVDLAKDDENEDETDSNIAFFRVLYQVMLDNEVEEKYANAMIDELADCVKPNSSLDHLLSTVYQRMVLKFGEADTIRPSVKGPKVIFFIGPTGVGKTTTIAKLASCFTVEERKKIALLTSDTYRIAAAEQLRTYANILEVPFRIIYTPSELCSAIRDFAKCDYILVDTAGHSPHNAAQKEGMADLLGALDYSVEKEVFLVVSATTKYRDLCSIADSYRKMTDYSLIFTKVDETTTLGSLLNLRLYTGAPLAYITIGQNVPDDIEVFNAQETVKMLLGGQSDAAAE
ncbi:MAG: flagellar biosynthesis protein FlhF [Lachnospiraceae bacterium]|nr:flagellar biosynthesis protein FlhF [Lachnospiraceae bacterium]